MTSSLSVFTWALTVVAVVMNGFVYLYPAFNEPQSCRWYSDTPNNDHFWTRLSAELKQKVGNSPQLTDFLPSIFDKSGQPKDIRMLAFGDPQINGNWPLTKYIKRLDNFGNDYYLGHIYNVMKTRMTPSHVVVMGDLFLSQWIYDSEFYNRTYRYVNRLFPRNDPRYSQTVLDTYKQHENYDWQAWMEKENAMDPKERYNSRVYDNVYDWTDLNASYPLPSGEQLKEPLFINLTGNHDIGYSGDATWQHMARFHHLFGQNNYVINYNKGTPYEWRIVVLDLLTLEGPALQEEFLKFTWSFLENLERDNANFHGNTVLLTHIPFYKPDDSFCTDGPQHIYYENYEKEPYKNGKLRLQNHLSYETTQKVLDIVFPNRDKNGIILTGHDHEGCHNYYERTNSGWAPVKPRDFNSGKDAKTGINGGLVQEIVVRLMMGDYNGNTGIMTGVYNQTTAQWDFHYVLCPFVVQHWWWVSKIITGLTFILQTFLYLRKSL